MTERRDESFMQQITRRAFLGRAAQGVGTVALASLLGQEQALANAAGPKTQRPTPNAQRLQLAYPAKAKRVIWVTMAGGPSHLETFDHKPKLAEMHGKPMPESITAGQQLAQLQGKPLNCFGPQWGFKKFGQSGAEICELFPHIGSVADDIAFIRSMTTDAINHD